MIRFPSRGLIERLTGVELAFQGVTKNPIMGNRRTRLPGVNGNSLKRMTEFDPNRHHVRMIDWPRTMTDPDRKIAARLYEEPREIKVYTIVNVTGLNFVSQWRPKVEQGASALGCLMMSAAETHDPTGLIICSDWRFMTEMPAAPMRQVLQTAIEEVFDRSQQAAVEELDQRQLTYAGMEEAIQHLPPKPSIVTLVMSVQADDSHTRRRPQDLTSQERLWQVVGGARDAGHDVRCVLIVDPIEEELPGQGVFTYRFADGTELVTTADCRRQWKQNFADALARQRTLMATQSLPVAIMRTNDSDDQVLNSLYEVSQGY